MRQGNGVRRKLSQEGKGEFVGWFSVTRLEAAMQQERHLFPLRHNQAGLTSATFDCEAGRIISPL